MVTALSNGSNEMCSMAEIPSNPSYDDGTDVSLVSIEIHDIDVPSTKLKNV